MQYIVVLSTTATNKGTAMTRTEASVTALLLLILLAYPVLHLLVTGDFIGSDNFYGLQEDSTAVDILLTFREYFTK